MKIVIIYSVLSLLLASTARAQPPDAGLQKVYDDICHPRLIICQHEAARAASGLINAPRLNCDTELDQKCKIISERYHATMDANAKALEDATMNRLKREVDKIK